MDVNSNNKSGSDKQMIVVLLILGKEKKRLVPYRELMEWGYCK